jgi:hypothetical protein
MKKHIATIVLISLLLGSCAVKSHLATLADAAQPIPTKIVLKRDTVRLPATTRKLTQKEAQDYLRKQYKLNYDELVSPDMKRLYAVIESQAKSLHDINQYMEVTRHRTDSIVRERNYYRKQADNRDSAYQNKVISLQRELIVQAKNAQDSNRRQINFNTIVAVSCLVGVVIIAVSLLGLWYRVNKLYRNFNALTNA